MFIEIPSVQNMLLNYVMTTAEQSIRHVYIRKFVIVVREIQANFTKKKL